MVDLADFERASFLGGSFQVLRLPETAQRRWARIQSGEGSDAVGRHIVKDVWVHKGHLMATVREMWRAPMNIEP